MDRGPGGRNSGSWVLAGAGGACAGTGRGPEPLLLLPVLLFSAQLLAEPGTVLAGTGRPPLSEAAGLHGLPAFPGTRLALRPLGAALVLSRLPLLAGPVLISIDPPASRRTAASAWG